MLQDVSILVVDDEEIMREILDSLLGREGCQITLASSGEEAVEIAKTRTFDVAIVDIMMPGIDGTRDARGTQALR